MTRPALPASVTDLRINLVGVAALVATVAGLAWSSVDRTVAAVLVMASVALPVLLLEVLVARVHQRPSTGLDWSSTRPRDPGHVATRIVGATAAAALPLAVYALAPEYHGHFYDPFYWFLGTFGPPAALLGLGYVAALDRYLVVPRDAFWHLGALLTGRWAEADPARAKDLLLGSIVKGFFFPLMFVALVTNVADLRSIVQREPSWYVLYDGLHSFAFLVDLAFTTIGYLLTLRVVDTQVRSAEPTAGGWAAALVCYQPFFSLVSQGYVYYAHGPTWADWLAPWPVAKIAWGTVMLLLLGVYVSATVTFGCRFSNLTNRGVLTNGPYRWVRHPAYLAKNLFWWMQFVPFWYRGSAYEVVQGCVWLLVMNWIYWLRARTEERHLSSDPAYVAYATAMNEGSLLAPLGRWFPFLAYRPPPSPR